MSSQYHKIPNVFKRPSDNPKQFTLWDWYTPELEALSDLAIWHLTEKVDGTNIRVIWDGNRVEFRGKTDKANLPPRLVERLEKLFEFGEEMFEQEWGETPVTFYGEGFGSKIQSGGDYFPDSNDGQNEFALFDVRIENVWLDRASVGDIALKFNVDYTPTIPNGYSLNKHILKVMGDVLNDTIPVSRWGGEKPIEGYVARTEPQFLDKRGNRIITKIKYSDFIAAKEQF